MRYFDLHLSQPDHLLHPMQSFIRHGDAVSYEELLTWAFRPDAAVEYELFYVVAERGPYERELAATAAVLDYTLSPVDEDAFFLYVRQQTQGADERLRAAFAERGLLVVPPVRFDDAADMWLTLVGDGDRLGEALDELPPGVSVDVEAIGPYDRRRPARTSALTDRQLAAVATAVELGYYDQPSQATLEDVGAALDCAASTAGTLLGRAERAVMERLVERPGLAME
jgi:hypothetical protein